MDIIKTLFDPLVTQERQQLAIFEIIRNYDIPFSFDELSELFTFIRSKTIEAWGREGLFTTKYYPYLFNVVIQNNYDFFLSILFGIKDEIITVSNLPALLIIEHLPKQVMHGIGCEDNNNLNLNIWVKLINHYPFVIESFNLSDKIKKIINDSICGRNIKPANISNRTKNNQINIEK